MDQLSILLENFLRQSLQSSKGEPLFDVFICVLGHYPVEVAMTCDSDQALTAYSSFCDPQMCPFASILGVGPVDPS